MCLSNLSHKIRVLQRLWGFIKSTPKPVGRPPTNPPVTWGLTLLLKTSTKSHSVQTAALLPALHLACWICIGPTPFNESHQLLQQSPSLCSKYLTSACKGYSDCFWTPSQQEPVLLQTKAETQVPRLRPLRPLHQPWANTFSLAASARLAREKVNS